ncbi:CybS-domain-containing protein [Rhodotorula toruloides]|uniref:Succinate dehydrogenase [ubiquinone] cytochrome b small subunit n=1 Tax=Rhodotorula toruloides (strain NP11) TaxID=1130832 RepID=M7XF32_RHOT1|nr:succinate dehydrogenase (ubiquinone) membrane anchor subunit [Rhodotorula toruloides NP11]EMS22444.1 succinate dehydrogenase (ubiquinone) membrane anchor subunit [Rhodotorula toruloides NP11]
MSLTAIRSPALRQLAARSFHSGRPLAAAQSSAAKPYVEGTVNDPTPFPTPNKAHGQYHWTFERLLSASLVPLIGATAVSSANPVLDGVLCTAIVAHSHMGFDQILTDYLHPRKFPVLGPIMSWLLRFATVGALVGVYQFETNDIGITELIKRAWKAEKEQE